jgi:polysaccharide export outer membrane protein
VTVKTGWVGWVAVMLAALAPAGCQTFQSAGPSASLNGDPAAPPGVGPWKPSVPTEKDKSSLPTYVIEPPDILLIDAVKVVPKPPYHIEPLDILQIVVNGTLLNQDIAGSYPVDPSGRVDLGPAYGKVTLAGLTLDEAKSVVEKHLSHILRLPEVAVTLAQSAGQQQVAGEHLVGPDGTVNLGTYGTVYVAGLTLNQAKRAIEDQLSEYLQDPKVALDMFAYNSKVYYVVTEGAGYGDTLTRFPITGNETVLDALAQVNGVSRLSSKHIWIARPAPGGVGCDQILPVNWKEITKGAATATNYQVLPGDRVFIAEDKMMAFDNAVGRLTAPFERTLGFLLLGGQSIQTLNRFPAGFQRVGANPE